MSPAETPPPYVMKADGDSVSVKATDLNSIALLRHLGFHPNPTHDNVFTKAVENDAIKAELFKHLRDHDISFAVGREWSPAEVFEFLREKHYLSGDFTAIAWKGPQNWFLRRQ